MHLRNLKFNSGSNYPKIFRIRERLNLKHCLDSSINEVKLPHDQLLPSQIITNVICKDFYDENTIIFKIHKNRKMYLTVDTNIDSEKVQINVDDIHVKESKKYKRISYNDSQYDIDVRIFKKKASHAYYDMSSRSFIYDTIKYLNIDFESKGHQTINLKRLDCKAIKPFAI